MPRITLVLAAGPGFPGGSAEHRYVLDVALDAAAQFDRSEHGAEPWTAMRIRPDEPVRTGEVGHDEETGWSLRFPGTTEAPELVEPMLEPGGLRPGEYLTLRNAEGEEFTYRVVAVA